MKMSGRQEKLNQQGCHHEQIIYHLNNNIYNNGLKFERDRAFRNKLIMKAIFIMAFLLIVVAVLCATMSKSSNSKTVYNETKVIKFLKKVSIPYEEKSIESEPEKEFFEELQTMYIPQSMNYLEKHLLTNNNAKKTKYRRNMNQNTGANSTYVNVDDQNQSNENTDLIWIKTRPAINEKKFSIKTLNSREDTENPSEKLEFGDKKTKSGHREDITFFWKKETDKNSIRTIQAQRMLSYMDETVNPCEDFYQYACGNWEKKNPIPEDKAGYDTFEMLRESLDSILRDLLMEPNHENTSDAVKKAKDLFHSCMDEDALRKRGNKPLHILSERLKGWPMIMSNWNSSDFDWVELMAQLRLYNNDIFLAQWVGPDIKSSANYIIQFDQTSLGLPTRDYYLQPSNAAYLEAYKAYMIQIAVLLGAKISNATADAEDLISFETKLARIISSVEDRRNISELYMKMTLSKLKALIPQIDWLKYLTIVLAKKIELEENVVVFALKYFKDLVKLIEATPPRTVSNYLMWRFMRHRVNYLGKEFQNAKQDFYFVLFGREKAPPRWTTCVAQVNSNMGMVLGSMFVRRYFDESSKNDTLNITHGIMNSFKKILNSTDWIGERTKILAQKKVDAMTLRIGYPDFVMNDKELNERYFNVNISKSLYFENSLDLMRHLARIEMNRLGSKVNKTEWNTPPAVVNAYYSRNKNQIMFPAGILQPPFYHKYFPKSLNYGGIGVVIGHEITHGFDDRGRLFDEQGNLDRWWDEKAIEKFHERAKCLIEQYSSYRIRDIDIRINGVSTQGENIADNGGIKQAFKAYEKWLSKNNVTDETLPGINATNFQLFFINFAQVWCGGMRPEASKNKLKTAVHSPGKYRVLGTLSNSEEFAKAFNCPQNSTMNLVKKCKVW